MLLGDKLQKSSIFGGLAVSVKLKVKIWHKEESY